jgi:hypothetical protein
MTRSPRIDNEIDPAMHEPFRTPNRLPKSGAAARAGRGRPHKAKASSSSLLRDRSAFICSSSCERRRMMSTIMSRNPFAAAISCDSQGRDRPRTFRNLLVVPEPQALQQKGGEHLFRRRIGDPHQTRQACARLGPAPAPRAGVTRHLRPNSSAWWRLEGAWSGRLVESEGSVSK